MNLFQIFRIGILSDGPHKKQGGAYDNYSF